MVHSESFLNSGSIDFFLLSSYFLFPSFTGQIFTICHVLMPWLLFTKYANGKSLINFQSWNKSPIPWIHTCSAKNVVQVMDKKNLAHIDINVPFKNYDDDVGVGNLLNKKKKKKKLRKLQKAFNRLCANEVRLTDFCAIAPNNILWEKPLNKQMYLSWRISLFSFFQKSLKSELNSCQILKKECGDTSFSPIFGFIQK